MRRHKDVLVVRSSGHDIYYYILGNYAARKGNGMQNKHGQTQAILARIQNNLTRLGVSWRLRNLGALRVACASLTRSPMYRLLLFFGGLHCSTSLRCKLASVIWRTLAR